MHWFSKTAAHYFWTTVVFIFLGIMVAWFAFWMVRDRKTLRPGLSHDCQENIKQLIEAQKEYAKDRDGRFAILFSDLYPDYIPSLRTFQCPSHMGEYLRDKSQINKLCEYEMVKGLDADSPGHLIFIFDKEGNHKHERNVGYIDGAIKQIHEFKFRTLLDEQTSGKREQ